MLGAFVDEAGNLLSLDWYRENIVALLNITMIDLVLAGDNAIVVGLAASRVAPEIRAKVIFWGITAAVVLRILFAAITVQLLAIIGLTLAGGILLLWVCWKMYRQVTSGDNHTHVAAATPGSELGFWSAVGLITLADVSMSLDNVLAVAGAAKGSDAGARHRPRGRDRADGGRLALHRRAARQVSLDHLDRPADHPLGGAQHDLPGLARGDLPGPSGSAALRTCGKAILHRLGLISDARRPGARRRP